MNIFLLKKQVLVLLLLIKILDLYSQPFVEQTSISLPGVSASSVAWGDYDNDDDLDLLLIGYDSPGNGIAKVYSNEGNNIFTEQTGISLIGVGDGYVTWIDYDNDNYLDILLTGSVGTSWSGIYVSKIYRNNGNNTFTEQTGISLPGIRKGSVAVGDYNNDGYQDILLTGWSASGVISKIYRNTGTGSFSEQTDISLPGVHDSAVSWGDYDNDGDLDFILTGLKANGDVISKLYKNNGNNSFTEQTRISIKGLCLGSVAWGDYDSDGNLDFLLTGATNDNQVAGASIIYHNNGDNTFSEQTQISLACVWRGFMAWGDYDNDGDLDILLNGTSGSQSYVSKIYRNNSDNTFTEQTGISLTGTIDGFVSFCDYDNDGDLDVIITGISIWDPWELISKVYRNDCEKINKTPDKPLKPGYEIQNSSGILRWERITSDETSSKSITYNVRVGRVSSASNFVNPNSDLNGKRKIVAAGNAQLDTTFIYNNLRWDTIYYASVQAIDNSFIGGPFSDEVQIKISPVHSFNLVASHINKSSLILKWKRGNGDRCIVFAKEGTSGTASPQNFNPYYANSFFGDGSPIGTTGWYCIYKGAGDSVLLNGLDEKINYIIHVIEFQGINGSEIYDVTPASSNNGIFSTAMFSEQTGIVLPDVYESSVAWGDYDNDGFLDILMAGNSPDGSVSKIYRNNGNNTFTEQTGISLPGVSSSSATWGDYDNDDYLDILLTGSSGPNLISKVYKNNGNNSFSEQTGISLLGVKNGSAKWGDYNNDGFLDILITGSNAFWGSPIPISALYKNNGNNSFPQQTGNSLINVHYSSVDWGDYNNDGDLDILLSGFDANYNPISKIFSNNGDNTFTEQTTIPLEGVWWGSVTWSDYDNDGDLDILLTGDSSGFISKIFRNYGNNIFIEQTGISLTGIFQSSVAWGDYDNDGFLDILMTGSSPDGSVSKIYHNNGDNTFSEQTDIYLASVWDGSVSWGDYDNDGDMDILVTGFIVGSGGISRIYCNNLFMKAGVFTVNKLPEAPTGLTSTVLPGYIRLSWARVHNDETPAKTMSYNIRYKLKDSLIWKGSPSAADNGFRRVPAMGNVQLNTSYTLKNLPSGTYYWQVQAVDQGYAGGAWSEVDSFVVKNTQAFFKTDTVCIGLPTHFTDQSVATDGISSWKWDFKDGTISFIQNPVHLYSSGGTYLVKLIITSTAGDKDSLEQNIIVKAKPVAGFNAPTICQGTSSTITNTSNNNGLSITSWYWDLGDGQTSLLQQPAPHGYLGAADYNVTLKALANNGCIDSISKIVTVASYPIAVISSNAPLTFCKGDSAILSVQYNNKYTYNWMTGGTNLTGADSSRYVARMTGSYEVEVVNSAGNCKTASSAVTVTALDAPAAPFISASKALEFCQGDSVELSVTNTTGYSYQWKLNGGSVGLNSSKFTAKNSGTYNLTVSNANKCSVNSTNSVNVTVNPAPSAGNISLNGENTFCEGGSVTLSVPVTAGYSYNWRNEYGLISGATTESYKATTSGIYQLEISNMSECIVRTSPVTITVKPSPDKPVLVPTNYKEGVCPGDDPIRLSANQTVPGYSYQWIKNGVVQLNDTLSYIEFYEQGIYKLKASIGECMSESDTFNINLPASPDKPAIYVRGPAVWYLVCSNTTAKEYRWYCNGELIQDAKSYFYVAVSKVGMYQVSISNIQGCFTRSDVYAVPTGYTGTDDVDLFEDLKIYPNPTKEVFTIEMDNNIFGELTIDILTEQGKEILSIKFEKSTEHFSTDVNLSRQAKGLYIINLLIDKYFAIRKLVVE